MESEGFSHDKEYHDIINNKESLRRCAEKLLNNIIDELTLGVIFDTHRKAKMKSVNLDERGTMVIEEDMPPNVDIFGHSNVMQECECPNCDRVVSTSRFAQHLENCMGLGRLPLRHTTRRVVKNNETNNNKDRDGSDSGVPSDNENDADWIMGDKRRKKKQRNGTKKGKGACL